MKLYKTYSGENFPKTYLVVERDEQPEKIVPSTSCTSSVP